MCKGKLKFKISIFAFLLVSMILFTFALPCSAKQTITFNPVSLTNLTADYEKGALIDGSYYLVDEGTQNLTYNGMGLFGGLVYYKYQNAPFNVGAPTSSGNNGQSYSVAVDVGNLNMQIPYSTSSYIVRTRIAIGNGSSILSMTPRLDVSVYSSSDFHIKDLKYIVKGNVAYIEDTITPAEMISGNVSIRITFYFGDAWGVTSVPWSNSTYLYLSSIIWDRAEDLGDVLNYSTDKNNQANDNADSFKTETETFEKDIFDSFNEVYSQIPDIGTYQEEIEDTIILSNIMSACFLGLGDGFTVIWWVAVTVGILCTFIGLLVPHSLKRDKGD